MNTINTGISTVNLKTFMISKGATVAKIESRPFPADKKRTIQQKDKNDQIVRIKLSELNNLTVSVQYD